MYIHFNLDKTTYTILSKKQKLPKINIQLNSKTISHGDTMTYLGVMFDRKLNWKTHSTQQHIKLSRLNGLSIDTRQT